MVLTNAPWRLEPAPGAEASARTGDAGHWPEAIVEGDATRAEGDATRAELAAAYAERDAMRAQLEALQNSTSWKITSGLRAIGRVLKPRE